MSNRFAAIVRWEVKYYLRRLSTWVYFGVFFVIAFLFMLTVAGAFGDVVPLGSGGKVKANSPLTIAQLMPVLSLLGVSITAALAGNALYRDYDAGMDPLLYTAPLSKGSFLGGRFVGSLVVNALVLLGIGFGAAIAYATPWAHPERLAPFELSSYLWPYITHILPNLVFSGAIFFSLVALTRQMLPNYIGGVVMLLGYLLSAGLLQSLDNRWLAAVLDPFGMRALRLTTEYWTIAEKNDRLVPMSGMLLANRAVWSAIGLLVFAVAYRRFSFSHALPQRPTAPPTRTGTAAPVILAAPLRLSDLPRVSLAGGVRARWAQFGSILRRSLWRIVGNRYFAIIVAAGLVYLVLAVRTMDVHYGTTTWPVTYLMVEILSGNFALFMLVIMALYAGELVWAERDVKLHGIHDATPVGSLTMWLAKLAALALVIALLQVVLMAAGIAIQAADGYFRFQVAVYLQSLLLIQFVDLLLLAILAFAVHVVVDNKFLGHFVVLLLVLVEQVQGYVGLEHPLFELGSDGGAVYSDMNGWGPYLRSWIWWKAYWLAFGGLLLVLVHLFWVRGADTDPGWRLAIARRRLSGRTARAAGAGTALMAGLGGFIYYNTNVLNTFRDRDAERDLRVTYEQRYKKYERMAQPRISSVSIDIDLYPKTGDFDVRGHYILRNRDSVAIDSVIVVLSDALDVRRMDFEGGATKVVDDAPRNLAMYRLASPLMPGDSSRLDFEIGLHQRGFPAEIENTEIVSNGTFLPNGLILPSIGYQDAQELSDDDARTKAKLPAKDRMRPPTDPTALRNSYVSRDADFVTYEATVTTDADQQPLTSGAADSIVVRDGRASRHFKLTVPSINLFAILSGRYATVKDRWRDVEIEISHDPAHAYNIRGMIDGVKESLEYFTREFGPYQHRIVRIVEFPRYASFAQSLANIIPYSEAVGFIARLDDPKDIDYPFYVTAHEVAHQWWAHQVVGADAQGATLLSETLSQYGALMVMEKRFGRANMRRFLQFELDRYLIGRSGERKREMPLQLVENQQYIHYNKGSVVMYALRDYVGEAKVNAALRGFLEAHKFKGPPYPTGVELVDSLRAVTPDSLRYLIHDLFETITLYEMKTDSIVVTDTTENRFRVDIFGSARKFRADSVGVETELEMSDWIEIALFRNAARGDTLADKNGVPVYEQKHRLGKGAQHITVITTERPIRGGIDPMHKLIDRKVDDNTTGVFDRSKSRLDQLKAKTKR